jgi:hypothetical protein
MSEPTIAISNVHAAKGGVNFDAKVAGYALKLRMPPEFIDDEMGSADPAKVKDYFARHDAEIRKAAWALAYALSTRDQSSNDEPGPVPYIGALRVPFNRIIVRA